MSETRMEFKEGSRRNWASRGASLSIEQIQAGALLRVADACEKMCLDREKLERDYKYMRQSRDQYRELYETERKRSAGLKGYVKRLQKVIEHFKVES